jgi:hypothetical protein
MTMPNPYPSRSIAVLRYPQGSTGYATGFFVDTKNFGAVCVTSAHVFFRDRHPGPDRTKILINGKLATLKFDAFKAFGIDVALIDIPEDFDRASLIFHTPGVSLNDASAFYAHAWSAPREQPQRPVFTKIWGVRFGPHEAIDNDADPEVARPVKQWLLRSDVAKRPSRYEAAIFQEGWSGAPVFNVRSAVSDSRVIGVLSSTAGEREATAVSVESLEFLEPREEQREEIMPPALVRRGGQAADAVAEVAALRYAEIIEQDICPKITEPSSPYDGPRPQ